RRICVPEEEDSRAELIVTMHQGLCGWGREPRVEGRYPGRRSLIGRASRIGSRRIPGGSDQTVRDKMRELAVHVPDTEVQSDSCSDFLQERIPMTWTVVP